MANETATLEVPKTEVSLIKIYFLHLFSSKKDKFYFSVLSPFGIDSNFILYNLIWNGSKNACVNIQISFMYCKLKSHLKIRKNKRCTAKNFWNIFDRFQKCFIWPELDRYNASTDNNCFSTFLELLGNSYCYLFTYLNLVYSGIFYSLLVSEILRILCEKF